MSFLKHIGQMDLHALSGDGAMAKIAAERALPAFLHIDHAQITTGSSQNLMHASQQEPRARLLLNDLSNHGYYLYMATDGVSRFVKHERIHDIWQNIINGTFNFTDDGILYQYEPPASGPEKQLVVVFSSMGDVTYETSLNRYFVRNFSSLHKFVPPGTGILRIGDLGGVKGAFYLNTTFLTNNETKISNFIENFVNLKKIQREKVVLFGPSKGGTGSLFNSLAHGWNVVAVDPLTSDEVYVTQHGDSHFVTGGIFPREKPEVFAEAVTVAKKRRDDKKWQRVIITSTKSPQKRLTESHLARLINTVTVLDSGNPKITGHVNVSANTLWAQTLAINSILTGLSLDKGPLTIP